jgi:small subunit ribosomal protein S2
VRLYIAGAADAILDGRSTAAAMVGRGAGSIQDEAQAEA